MLRSFPLTLPFVLIVAGWAPAQEFKLYTTEKTNDIKKGVKITAIPKVGIENELGLRPGDTILTINGKNITNTKELSEALGKMQVHNVTEARKEPTTNLSLIRSGQSNPITISGWIIRSSFPDAKTGKAQYYFRSKEPPRSVPKKVSS